MDTWTGDSNAAYLIVTNYTCLLYHKRLPTIYRILLIIIADDNRR